jgi:DUF4097 and DUF4098 domain-containing protein YvlB
MKSPTIQIVFAIVVMLCAGLAPAQERESGYGHKTSHFEVTKGGRLVVSVDGGDVRITPTEKNQVTVDVTGGDDDELEDLRMSASGNTVRVQNTSDCGSCDLRYVISIPNRFDVDITTSAGNITIEGSLSGKIMGRTSAGNIRLGNTEGTVDMTTSGGNIKTGNVKGDLSVSTSGGDIVLGAIDGDADAGTSGGDIRIERVGKILRAKTSGGDVRIGDVGGEADVSTAGGTIVVGKVGGKASLKTAGGDIDIASANGSVNAKTAGGNLRLDEIRGSIIAKTAGGDIEATMYPSGTGKSKLSTAAGEVRLYIPENAKATIDARIRVTGRVGGDEDDEYRIYSDFKAATEGKSEEDDDIRASYRINGGGESITLETTNADIMIRKIGSKGGKWEKGAKGEKGDKGEK